MILGPGPGIKRPWKTRHHTSSAPTSHHSTNCDTIEALIAGNTDQLDLILELNEQQDLGNSKAKEWISFAIKRLSTQNARDLANKITKTHSSDWRFDTETDLWINGTGNHYERD
ncbi:MAG: hypothetical protein V2J25_11955 [Desulfatiglans sp.]|jgi:putative hydrolase of HD superfamily|nr:hypothetical protein [Desulfatiglans sp.]